MEKFTVTYYTKGGFYYDAHSIEHLTKEEAEAILPILTARYTSEEHQVEIKVED